MMLAYHVELTPDDNGTLLVTCPKIPMVAAFGETTEAALHHAIDAIEVALGTMIADGEPIPEGRCRWADRSPLSPHDAEG